MSSLNHQHYDYWKRHRISKIRDRRRRGEPLRELKDYAIAHEEEIGVVEKETPLPRHRHRSREY